MYFDCALREHVQKGKQFKQFSEIKHNVFVNDVEG